MTTDQTEYRAFPTTIEIRKKGDREVIAGTIPYGTLSHEMGGIKERIMPGAFSEQLAAGTDVLAKVEHGLAGSGHILGRKSSGTLTLDEKPHGIEWEVDPPQNHPDIEYLKEAIRRKDIPGSSFGMMVAKQGGDRWTVEKGQRIREIHKAKLTEVSPTHDPAYPDADVAVALRSLAAWSQTEEARSMLGDYVPGSNDPGSTLAGVSAETVAPAVDAGDFVRWWRADPDQLRAKLTVGRIAATSTDDGSGRGVALRIHGTDLSLPGSENNPACLIVEWCEGDDGYHEPAECVYLVAASRLEKIEPPEPLEEEDVLRMADELADQARADRLRMAPDMLAPDMPIDAATDY